MIKKWIKEIETIGFGDWIWFVFVLRRNTLHVTLDVDASVVYRLTYEQRKAYFDKLICRRNLAQYINIKLNDI